MNSKYNLFFLILMAGILLNCQGNSNSSLNQEIETEYQILSQEQEFLLKEHENLEKEFKKMKDEFKEVDTKSDLIFDEHLASLQHHNDFINQNFQSLNQYQNLLKEYIKTIKNHTEGKISDEVFRDAHNQLIAKHQDVLNNHKKMKELQYTLSDTHKVVMKKAKSSK